MGRLVTGPQHYRRRFLSPVVWPEAAENDASSNVSC
jgi:hypothetical protein